MVLISRLAVIAVCCAMFGTQTVADDNPPSAKSVLADFAKQWDESLWRPKKVRGGYMRPLDDRGWQARMIALQQLVKGGKQSVPVLVETLKRGRVPERILAAQALGYLAPHAPVDVLLESARSDEHPAVRLYAVDSLGMQGHAAQSVDWKSLLAKEGNRDVKMHIKYARERNGAPVKKEVVAALKNWNADSMNTAALGKPAPQFTLKSAQGKTVRLADFKGKQAVVLVFIYGDT